jgi:osmotically-inducible protein OsmY
MSFWDYPTDRYYYGWYGAPFDTTPNDADIKSNVVDRLRDDEHTRPFDLRVDVKQRVVVLGGHVSSSLAKRVAGDDAWDTRGVVDVSNQIVVDAA